MRAMIQSDNWIYLHLQKTGGTFIESKLLEIFRGSSALEVLRKHHREVSIVPGRLRMMNIRDPINYYFSLWSYGLDSQGGFFRRLSRRLPAERLKAIYGGATIKAFDSFIAECFKSGEHDVYTQRTLRMIIPQSDPEALSASMSEVIDGSFYDSYLSKYEPHVMLPTEGLNRAFHQYADSRRLDPLGLPVDWKAVFPLDAPEVNQSQVSRKAHGGQIDRNELISSTSHDLIVQRCVLPSILHGRALQYLGSLSANNSYG